MLLTGTMIVDVSTIIEEGAVVVDGDRIVAVGVYVDLTDRYPNHEQRESGTAAPGLAGGHVYSMQPPGRGIADDTGLLDRFLNHIFPMKAGFDAEGMRVAAKLGHLERIESGTTTVVNHLSVRHVKEAFEAAGGAGIRGRIGKVLTNMNVLEGLQEGTNVGLVESERLTGRHHDSLDGRIQYAVTSWFAVTCSEACPWGAHDLADRYGGVCIHTHASGNRNRVETAEDEMGMHSIHWLDEVGLTGDDVVLAHCVHIDDSEHDVFAETGAHITYCPLSNIKLVSGIVPIPGYLDRGINITLGNDGPPHNNTLNLFTEIRQASLSQEANALDPTSTPAATVLEMATRNDAKTADFDRIGELREGWKADIVGINADRTRATPFHDMLPHLVFAVYGDDVVFIMADGDVLYDEDEHVRANADGV